MTSIPINLATLPIIACSALKSGKYLNAQPVSAFSLYVPSGFLRVRITDVYFCTDCIAEEASRNDSSARFVPNVISVALSVCSNSLSNAMPSVSPIAPSIILTFCAPNSSVTIVYFCPAFI